MPKICYIDKVFAATSVGTIAAANEIIAEYEAQGFTLTLRQLYYQFVARDVIPNTLQSYKRLGSIVNDAKLAGMIDWDSLEDRTRFLRANAHWSSPSDILDSCIASYARAKWATQPYHVEVWIEKDALIGIIEPTCQALDVACFSCRGYVSGSALWRAARRLLAKASRGVLVLHLGDHDPSGLDMTRDMRERIDLYTYGFVQKGRIELRRIALTAEQIEKYTPPPNPTKLTDSRAPAYVADHGDDSWELDALEPRVIVDLVHEHVMAVRDGALWSKAEADEAMDVAELQAIRDGLDEQE